MPHPRATWPRGHVLSAIRIGLLTIWPQGQLLSPRSTALAALAGLALAACFTAPADAVLFACTAKAPDCPDGYTCADDGCCHRDGSDITANYGACGLGGPATGPLATGTDVGTDVGTGTTAPTSSSTSTDASTGAEASTTSATDASSTSAGTGP